MHACGDSTARWRPLDGLALLSPVSRFGWKLFSFVVGIVRGQAHPLLARLGDIERGHRPFYDRDGWRRSRSEKRYVPVFRPNPVVAN